MVKVGDVVVYGEGMSRGGAALPARVGHQATVVEMDTKVVGFCTVQFEDGKLHICPIPWAKVVK